MADVTADRVEVAITVTDNLWSCKRIHGDREKLVLRGGRGHIADVLVKALAEATGDPVLAKLDGDELVCAIRTLGEIGYHGLDADLQDELSKPQVDVLNLTGSLWSADVHVDEHPHTFGDYSDVQ